MKILFKRRYKGYMYQRELHSGKDYGCADFEVVKCYTHDGNYIGDAKMTRHLMRLGITRLQKAVPDHCVCTIGYKDGKWYGWSHRAICGFGIGDKIFIEKFGNDKTPFKKHGRTTITNMLQAKIAAKRFAKSVS